MALADMASVTASNELMFPGSTQTTFRLSPIGLHHPVDGVTNPKYKLLHFLTTKYFIAKRRRH
jgi:hypothetical protein